MTPYNTGASTTTGQSGRQDASPIHNETDDAAGKRQAHTGETLFGRQFSAKEQKKLFLYLVIGIVLVEMAVTVAAVVYSITNAQPSPTGGAPRFRFPWIGYTVAVITVPVLAMLLLHLINMGISRGSAGDEQALESIPQRIRTFFALVRGAPTVILFAGFVLAGAAIYYLDSVMTLLLKLGEHFHLVAIWIVGGFAFAWTVSYVARTWMQYKTRQMEAEYAFRREVLERTGVVILETKYAPTTKLHMLPTTAMPDPKAIPQGIDATPALPETHNNAEQSTASPNTGPNDPVKHCPHRSDTGNKV